MHEPIFTETSRPLLEIRLFRDDTTVTPDALISAPRTLSTVTAVVFYFARARPILLTTSQLKVAINYLSDF